MAALAALVAPVTVAPLAADVAGAQTRAREAPHRYADVAAAVRGGAVDEQVARALAGSGRRSSPTSAGDARAAVNEPGVVLVTVDIEAAKAAAAARLGTNIDDVPYDAVRDQLAAQKQQVLAHIDGALLIRDYPNLDVMAVDVPDERSALSILNAEPVTGLRANATWRRRLSTSLPYVNQPAAAAQGANGNGIVVAVIDSGIDYRRSAFGSCTTAGPSCKVLASLDFAPDDGVPDDADLHGTLVGGIVAGVAPSAKLLSLDVFDGEFSSATIELTAVDWLIARKLERTYDVRVANMSFGSGMYESGCPDILGIRALLSAGILPVAAAGNSGYGVIGRGIDRPACIPGVISVGALYDADLTGTLRSTDPPCSDVSPRRDQISCISSSAPILSMLAPGIQISAAGVSGSGTSMAAPHVAGAAAALASLRPTATIDQLRTALVSSGPQVNDPRIGRSFPRLDVNAAANSLKAMFPSPAGYVPASAPTRLLDTRATAPITAGQSIELQVSGRNGIPSNISAVVLNVTVDAPEGIGFVAVYPADSALPTISNLNFVRDQTVPNLVMAKVSGDGKVRIHASARTHVIVDAQGWYVADGGARYTPAPSPQRVLDTRGGNGVPAPGKIASEGTVELQVTGRGGVPTDATAVLLNVTVTETEERGYITVYPHGAALPTASNLNYVRGETIANLVLVKVGDGGRVRLRAHTAAQLIADVQGWYGPTGVGTGAVYEASTPSRLVDTRDGTGGASGMVGAGTSLEISVPGRAGVPQGATAVVLNVTVTDPQDKGWLTVSPSGVAVPDASNLNFVASQTIPNLVVAKIGSDGKVRFTPVATTHLVIDVQGWYR